MIKGVGVDLLKISHLEAILSSENYTDDSFIRRTFTGAEIALAESRPQPIYCFATRFAAKEAIFKILNRTGEDLRLNEIEILADDTGRPEVRLYGSAKALAESRGIENIHLSLSYEAEYAVAYAAAE